jgi:hypothetical protein
MDVLMDSDVFVATRLCMELLVERIQKMEIEINSAKIILVDGHFTQCSFHLAEAAKHASFDEFQLSVFDSLENKIDRAQQ